MPRFPHLSLVVKQRGDARFERTPFQENADVKRNRQNREGHGASVRNTIENFARRARQLQEARHEAGLPEIRAGVPFVLRIPDEDEGAIEFVAEKLGLEVVAEYDEGFLIVSSADLELQRVIDLANEYVEAKRGSGGLASILAIDDDPLSEQRIARILQDGLIAQWPFPDDQVYLLDLSIEVAAFGAPTRPRVGRAKPETRARKEAEHTEKKAHYFEMWEGKRIERETEIEEFVDHYGGEICSITDESHLVEFPDSFSMRIRMSGRGFKDLISNYPNLFEVSVPDEIGKPIEAGRQEVQAEGDFELRPPGEGDPSICVIDSGIQEGHRYLQAAVFLQASRCFVPGKTANDVADEVAGGGHGTRVAGACLYPHAVPRSGVQVAPFWLINVRVLDAACTLQETIFPAELLREIITHFREARAARIYQHSIGSRCCCRSTRMSTWAAAIDWLSYQHDALFIQAAGNISGRDTIHSPGILDHLAAGRPYPDFLYEASSRLCNPAQSLQAITVGSISREYYQDPDRQSVSPSGNPSSFSRTGFGLWDSIKPEVVEIGGEFAIDHGNPPSLTNPPEVCPELVRSTLNGGPAFDRDQIGTSFAAPKVAHIAGHLAALFPDQGTLLYRALIINSARWPIWADGATADRRVQIVRSIGYGLPDLSRATENTENRVTLISETEYEIRANEGFVFGVPIPQELRRPGDPFQVRIDVTLSYAAQPRRTRKSRRGYLSVWLDWKSSKKGERFETFKARALKDFEGGDGADEGNVSWTLGNRMERDGLTPGVTRRNGTVQKDWAIVDSHELPDVFGIVVRGHKGWDRRNPEATARFALAVSFEALGSAVNLYESIREAIEAEVQAPEAVIEVTV